MRHEAEEVARPKLCMNLCSPVLIAEKSTSLYERGTGSQKEPGMFTETY